MRVIADAWIVQVDKVATEKALILWGTASLHIARSTCLLRDGGMTTSTLWWNRPYGEIKLRFVTLVNRDIIHPAGT